MKPCLIAVIFILLLYACDRPVKHTVHKAEEIKTSVKPPQPLSPKLVPVLGYRFKITGDFDGDGKKDTLTERFISRINHWETNKFYENGDYDTLVKLNSQKKIVSLLSCNNRRIPNLITDSKGRSLGLFYAKNEGDLDGDGGDEVSCVVDWADWSNVNFCDIMTCKNHKWELLYHFQIRDWMLPDLPQTYNEYGIAGRENKIINTIDTAANRKIEKNLTDFKGLIKKVANNKIQIIHVSDDAEVDTAVVDIRKHHQRKG